MNQRLLSQHATVPFQHHLKIFKKQMVMTMVGCLVPNFLDSDAQWRQHVRMVREVHEEVNQAREKATVLKQRRQEQATNRREKLKQAYVRKQLEKLKAQQQQLQQQDEEKT